MLFFLINLFFSSVLQHNELKEYGLKGNVKTVIITQYDSLMQVNNNWRAADEASFSRFTYYYNAGGFADSVLLEYKRRNDEKIYSAKTINHFINGIKTTAESFSAGQLYEKTTFTWGDEYTYGKKTYNAKGTLTGESTILLNKEFRERGGEFKTYGDRGIMVHVTYENVLDENNLVKEIKTKDNLTGKLDARYFVHQKFDSNNNPCESVTMVNGKAKWLTVRAISYY